MGGSRDSARERERAMNRFAGAFLVPEAHLVPLAGRNRGYMNPPEILQLKRIYGVSAAAMLVRLRQVGLLSRNAESHAFRTFARDWRKREPESSANVEGFAMFEKPQRIERLVWQAIAEQLISPVRAAEMLRIPLREVENRIIGV